LREKAQDQLERGLKQSPGLPHFLSLLGEVRRELGDPGASVELNRKAIEAGVTMTPAHYFLALAYLDLKQEQAAMAEFEKAIHSPLVTPETYNAGVTVSRNSSSPKRKSCRKAIAMDRSRPDAYLNLARIYNAQQASDKALEVLRVALPEGREFPRPIFPGTTGGSRGGARRCVLGQRLYAQAIAEWLGARFGSARAIIHRRLANSIDRRAAGAALHTKEADNLEKGQR
jgi:tetratricopeptide (TPR) repeat protein